ncbi:replication factor A protein 3 [Naematelia encephala]|uniref:Replication factor A protein 3 n=1 Tax=Naematelia encephala TaxID=71784 RepID=A0A1Y2AKN8_9TREE|nr:replication factor A protein 3 [Naematelia encephala]
MSRLGAEPRINARLIPQFKGQTVRFTAKVLKMSGDTATVESSDKQEVGVILARDTHIATTFVEIIAMVKDDLTLKCLTSIDLGDSIDMKAVNNVVDFANSSKGAGVLS